MKASSASKNFFMILPSPQKTAAGCSSAVLCILFSLYNFPAAAARAAISPFLLL